jgi:hypothetical protein
LRQRQWLENRPPLGPFADRSDDSRATDFLSPHGGPGALDPLFVVERDHPLATLRAEPAFVRQSAVNIKRASQEMRSAASI